MIADDGLEPARARMLGDGGVMIAMARDNLAGAESARGLGLERIAREDENPRA